MKSVVNFERLRGFCIACCHMEEKEIPEKLKELSLLSRLEEEKRKGYKVRVKLNVDKLMIRRVTVAGFSTRKILSKELSFLKTV